MPEEKKGIQKHTLFSFIDAFITESAKRKNDKTDNPLSKATFTIYKRTRQLLKEYEAFKKRKLDFKSIDLNFYLDWTDYLSKKQKFSTNSIGKEIKTLKTFLNAATDAGINTNMAYKSSRFKVITEQTESIYLSEKEIKELVNLDLSKNPKLEKVKDLFVVGCWTGLRFSDFSRIEKKHIKDGAIEIKTKKVGQEVVIPLHPDVTRIIKKYNGVTKNSLPDAISNQKMNEYLKEIGQKLNSLQDKAERTITKGGVKVTTINEKWKFLTTHTARRSFATNLYNDGLPANTIMKITGHKTEKSFFTYIKTTPKESANVIRLHWQKKEGLKVV